MTLDLVRAIGAYWGEHNYAPSVREIATSCGRSLRQTHAILAVLRSRGLIAFEDRQPRTLRLTREGIGKSRATEDNERHD